MSDSKLVFIDTETTSLDPFHGEIWEVGAITRSPDGRESEHRVLLDVSLDYADPMSLQIGGFHDRHPAGNNYNRPSSGPETLLSLEAFAVWIVRLTHGAHLVGAVPSFDEERMRLACVRSEVVPSWHYHLVDVEALVAGRGPFPPPWNSGELSKAVGVDPAEFDRHTALGDARWAMAIYDAVMS